MRPVPGPVAVGAQDGTLWVTDVRHCLSDREHAVLTLIADGRETDEIARELFYSTRTVTGVVQDITRRFRLRNRAHAVAYALRSGLLSRDQHPARPPGEAEVASPRPLTGRQTTVLTLMADGLGNGEIASALGWSASSVRNVSYELMARLQVRNRAHAVAYAVRSGLIGS